MILENKQLKETIENLIYESDGCDSITELLATVTDSDGVTYQVLITLQMDDEDNSDHIEPGDETEILRLRDGELTR